jgi:hypothetical protein
MWTKRMERQGGKSNNNNNNKKKKVDESQKYDKENIYI